MRARADAQLHADVETCRAELRTIAAEITALTPDPPPGTTFEVVVDRRRRLADLVAYRPVVERRLGELQHQLDGVVDTLRTDLLRSARETVEQRLRTEIHTRTVKIAELQEQIDDLEVIRGDVRRVLGQVGSDIVPLGVLIQQSGKRTLG